MKKSIKTIITFFLKMVVASIILISIVSFVGCSNETETKNSLYEQSSSDTSKAIDDLDKKTDREIIDKKTKNETLTDDKKNTTSTSETDSEEKLVSTPETKPETKPSSTPETTPETKPASAPETTPETKPALTSEIDPEEKPSSTPETEPASTPVSEPVKQEKQEITYIGNSNTQKFHYASCSSVDRMNDGNKVYLSSREEAINNGYDPCKRCNP